MCKSKGDDAHFVRYCHGSLRVVFPAQSSALARDPLACQETLLLLHAHGSYQQMFWAKIVLKRMEKEG